jgi:hypothetical protein
MIIIIIIIIIVKSELENMPPLLGATFTEPTNWSASSEVCRLLFCFFSYFSHVCYCYGNAVEYLNSTLWLRGGSNLMHCSLFKFTLFLTYVLPFWKLLVFVFLLGMSETSWFVMSAVQVQIVLLLDVSPAASAVCRKVDIFKPKSTSLNHILLVLT